MIETLTNDNFEEAVTGAAGPVLVELWAPWCVYCRRLSPALDRLAEKLGDQLAVGKINIDEQPELARELDAATIPHCISIKGRARGKAGGSRLPGPGGSLDQPAADLSAERENQHET